MDKDYSAEIKRLDNEILSLHSYMMQRMDTEQDIWNAVSRLEMQPKELGRRVTNLELSQGAGIPDLELNVGLLVKEAQMLRNRIRALEGLPPEEVKMFDVKIWERGLLQGDAK